MTKNDRSKTAPLSATPEQMKQHLPPRAALLIYHREDNTVVTLMAGESVVIGRSRPADVVIPDQAISSRHARFDYDGTTVTLTDLKSKNGTAVNNEPLTGAHELQPGDDIVVGNAHIVLLLLAQGERRPRTLDNHDRVAAAFDEELERARHFNRSVSLLLVGARTEGIHVGSFAPEVQDHLRAVDRAALLSPTILEVLLSERSAQEAHAVAEAIVGMCPDVAIGIATYPELCSGRADAMLDGARAALAVARKKGGVALAEKAVVRVADAKPAPVVASPSMKKLYENAAKFARSSLPVLIHGETGSGKEFVARALHDGGARKSGPMISVNCGALPESLIESTLFGTEKGAYTGAENKPGVFELAHTGTVFLDEIGEMPEKVQIALLRVLAERIVTRVGPSQKEIKVDVRVVCATHKDIEEMCAAGTFRADLRYRLDGERFEVPPLRRRVEEILPLARRFIEQSSDNTHIDGIDDEASAALVAYGWPGNVRELKNAIERAIVVSGGPMITLEDLPDRVRQGGHVSTRMSQTGLHRIDDANLSRDDEDSGPRAKTPPPRASPGLTRADANDEVSGDDDDGDFRSKLRVQKAKIIIDALEKCGGVQTAAAKYLKMPVRTLVHMIKECGIKRDKGRYVVGPPQEGVSDDA